MAVPQGLGLGWQAPPRRSVLPDLGMWRFQLKASTVLGAVGSSAPVLRSEVGPGALMLSWFLNLLVTQ